MASSQRNLMPFIFIILANVFITFIRAQPICIPLGNYTNNSTYQTNLISVFSSLSTNIGDNGFYNASAGTNSDIVNAYALCVADSQLDVCRRCVQDVSNDLLRACPNYRQGIVWSNGCMLRYSNVSLYGKMDRSPVSYVYRTDNITNPGTSFMYDLGLLIEYLRGQASSGDSLRKVAATSRSTSGSRMIYGMVQCTPDLSRDECYSCFENSFQQFQARIGDRVPAGTEIRRPSCNFRYEIDPFYNQTRIQELESSSLIPPVSSPPFSIPSPPSSRNDDTNRHNRPTRTIIIIVVPVLGSFAIIVFICCFIMKMKQIPNHSTGDGLEPSLLEGSVAEEISIFESLQYDFGMLKTATNDFSEANKLGQGGFGTVYKGTLLNGQEIAVKRLSTGSHQGDLEFKNEVMLLVKLQHRNLVRLLGYSRQGSEKLLVYEFVQNASLDAFIFDTTKHSLLDWDKRYKIIGGIARGILYLHEDSRLTIIHRDLKAGNVLLDGNMNPKIADFGMARLFVTDEIQGSTNRIVGTYGYMAPEYAMHGEFSVKSDVFSFGVLLLEIICGQKNNCFRHEETNRDLINSAWENWCQGTIANLVDPLLNVGSSVPRDILRCIHIGILCVQENAVDRPTMASVITMLNSFSISLPVPSHPAFFVHNRHVSEALPLEDFSWGEENSNGPRNNNRAEFISQNEMSISEFHAR